MSNLTEGDSAGPERVLVVAPMGADARNLTTLLARSGFTASACPHVGAAASEVDRGCGTLLLTEEALSEPTRRELSGALSRQPAWSDIPVVLIVSGGYSPAASDEAVRLIGERGNITMIERPVRAATLVSALRAAVRARRRQYEVKALLEQRDELLASLEQRVAERTAKLEQLNAELEAFSYSVSHDLRAPLRSLETYARLLCEDYGDVLPKEARHYADRIASNAQKMDRLTRDVLTLSRISRGAMPLDPLDLDVVVAEVIEQYPDLAEARERIEVRRPLGGVVGHGPSLQQCLSNLLQNALKFVPAGSVPHVRVYSQIGDQRVRIVIEDNGVGIDPAHHERIFGMFERADVLQVPGTGIGLAIAKKAVERMAGTIGVESAEGAGSRFWFELPKAPA